MNSPGLPVQLDQHQAVLAVVAQALSEVVAIFDHQLASPVEPVRQLCSHIERYRGKMLRPTLVLVSGIASAPAWRDTADIEPGSLLTRDHCVVAAVCEMVHMATLVHDDVLDEAEVRRRGKTVNNLRGNEAAVMLGDYLLASAYQLCATLPTPAPAAAIGRASMTTAAGELVQLHHRGDLSMPESTYFDIITGKTAELIATACQLGALASNAPAPAIEALRQFGLAIGQAFQIQDDILDLTGREDVVGKSVGKDLEKAKPTLPLIHHLRVSSAVEREKSLALAASIGTAAPGTSSVLLSRIESTGSVSHARDTARQLIARARASLRTLAASPARDALDTIAHAVLDRNV